MLPLSRVSAVIAKVLEVSNQTMVSVKKSVVAHMLFKSLQTHSSRQGKVVFVHQACVLTGCCRDTFRWIHATLPENH